MRKQFFLIIFLGIALIISVSTAFQVFAKDLKVNTLDGRYQYYEGPVASVFDTHTGKVFLWVPKDEKEG